MPFSSLRPKKSDTPRCVQNSSMSPTSPAVSRKAISFSPMICARTCGPSGSAISLDSRTGTQ
jgi:hypothetical protein